MMCCLLVTMAIVIIMRLTIFAVHWYYYSIKKWSLFCIYQELKNRGVCLKWSIKSIHSFTQNKKVQNVFSFKCDVLTYIFGRSYKEQGNLWVFYFCYLHCWNKNTQAVPRCTKFIFYFYFLFFIFFTASEFTLPSLVFFYHNPSQRIWLARGLKLKYAATLYLNIDDLDLLLMHISSAICSRLVGQLTLSDGFRHYTHTQVSSSVYIMCKWWRQIFHNTLCKSIDTIINTILTAVLLGSPLTVFGHDRCFGWFGLNWGKKDCF